MCCAEGECATTGALGAGIRVEGQLPEQETTAYGPELVDEVISSPSRVMRQEISSFPPDPDCAVRVSGWNENAPPSNVTSFFHGGWFQPGGGPDRAAYAPMAWPWASRRRGC